MEQNQSREKKHFYAEVFILGFLLLSAQIILVREFLIIFNGNELVIGILFSIWMLCTALGAWSGKFFGQKVSYRGLIRLLLIIIAVYPIIAAFGVEYFRNSIFETGRLISFYEILYFSSTVLFPLCFAGGLAFSLINISAENNSGNLQDCYSYESTGSLIGGAATSIIFIYYLKTDNFLTLQYLALIAFIYFGIAEFKFKRHFISFIYLLGAIGIMHLIYSYDLSLLAKTSLYPDQELLSVNDTPYGNLTVTRQNSQTNVYLDGKLLHSSDEVIRREEDVHYALLQNQNARKILMLGGGISGSSSEVFKYPSVDSLDYVEQNSVLLNIAKDLGSIDEKLAVNYIISDPVFYVKNCKKKYDIVLINQPSPSSAQSNRVYTSEFFKALKNIMNKGGVISTSLSSSQNYLSNDEILMHSSIYNSLLNSFEYVILIPGNSYYFLASDDSLSFNYNTMLNNSKVENTFVNSSYMDDRLLRLKSKQVTSGYLPEAGLNLNFKPTVYSVYISHWLSYFGITFWIIPSICILFVIVYLIFSRIHATAMFTSGFTGAATELLLIIAFQVIFGYVYIFLGLIITTFMAGLALGSRLSRSCKMKNPLRMLYFVQLFSGIYLGSIAITIFFIDAFSSMILVKVVFIFMMFFVAALTGLQYGVSVCYKNLNAGTTVSEVYASDLAGSAVGSLVVAIWLIPMIGIYTSLILLTGLHFLTIGIMALKRK